MAAVTAGQPGTNRNQREAIFIMHISKRTRMASTVFLGLVALSAAPAWAGNADVIGVNATRLGAVKN